MNLNSLLPWRRRERKAPVDRRLYRLDDTHGGTVGAVYRAAGIIAGAIGQLPLREEVAGVEVAPSPVVRRPDPRISRSEWIERAVLELLYTGNLYVRNTPGGLLVDPTLRPSPDGIGVVDNRGIPVDGCHVAIGRRAGHLYGRGPIQVARETTALMEAASQQARRVWTGSHTGILSTDQRLTAAEARRYRDLWDQRDPDTGEQLPPSTSGVRVLGGGLAYASSDISVRDAMWLEAQQWGVADVARVMGVPAQLLLAEVSGSKTYANVTQEWLGMVRFTLIPIARRLEDVFLLCLSREVRLDFDVLLRADPKLRYELYESGMRAGWLDREEVRKTEGIG